MADMEALATELEGLKALEASLTQTEYNRLKAALVNKHVERIQQQPRRQPPVRHSPPAPGSHDEAAQPKKSRRRAIIEGEISGSDEDVGDVRAAAHIARARIEGGDDAVAQETKAEPPPPPPAEDEEEEELAWKELVKLGPSKTWKQCKKEAAAYGGGTYGYDSSWTMGGGRKTVIYNCKRHLACKAKIRCVQIKTEEGVDAGAIIYTNQAVHSIEETSKTWTTLGNRGVGPEWEDTIRNMRKANGSALSIHTQLKLRHRDGGPEADAKKYGRIPSRDEIQSFINKNCSNTKAGLEWQPTDAQAWTSRNSVKNYDEVQACAWSDRPLVVKSFVEKVTVIDIVDTGPEHVELEREVTCLGYVATTKGILLWLRKFALNLDRPNYTLSFSADGTYKLAEGRKTAYAAVVVLGIFHVEWIESKDVEVSHFLPLVLSYIQVECFEAYREVFETMRDLPSTHLGLDGVKFKPKYGSLDCASYIAKVYRHVWPPEEA
jgi:hypothetical protein